MNKVLKAEVLNDEEMLQFQTLFVGLIGVYLPITKKALLCHRLYPRVNARGLVNLSDYYRLLIQPEEQNERQIAIDLLTTNETRFFREESHFLFFKEQYLPKTKHLSSLNIWCAACSTGEEAYSVTMMLQEYGNHLPPWSVVASDINYRVLEIAKKGLYPIGSLSYVPAYYRKQYCLQGTGEYASHGLIHPCLQKKITFVPMNLLKIRHQQQFDVIFLRNVMIYFQATTKYDVLYRIVQCLQVGGILIVGASESLYGMHDDLRMIAPSIYQRIR